MADLIVSGLINLSAAHCFINLVEIEWKLITNLATQISGLNRIVEENKSPSAVALDISKCTIQKHGVKNYPKAANGLPPHCIVLSING